MLESDGKLLIKWWDGSEWLDLSESMAEYGRDFENIVIDGSSQFLYVGYHKPIDRIYVEMETANTDTTVELAMQWWDGSLNSIDIRDETKTFKRSGYISWDKPLDDDGNTLEVAVDHAGDTAYWYAFRVTGVSMSAGTTVKGINLILADDQDMRSRLPEVVDDTRYFASGQSSHILIHQSARDEILQWLRRQQYTKKTEGDRDFKDITQWDLLDSYQLKLAATYKALAILFMEQLSDAPGDIYEIKGQRYDEKYKTARDLYLIEIDTDNDGVLDSDEVVARPQAVILRR